MARKLGAEVGSWPQLISLLSLEMMKALEIAIERVRHPSDERQAYAAHLLAQIADHRAAILEGLAQAKRGEFANDEGGHAILCKPWA